MVRMSSMSEPEVYTSASEAAATLGVSGTGLRRLADIYAEVHGDLERDPKTNNRIWTMIAVERLAAARTLLRSGRADSIKSALVAVKEGVEPPAGNLSTPPAGGVQGAALMMLAQRFEALEDSNREMREQLAELLTLNRALMNRLEAPKEDSERYTQEGRMNAHLLDELERKTSPHAALVGNGGDDEAGVLVRAAARLERLWARLSGRERQP